MCNCQKFYTLEHQKKIALLHQETECKDAIIYLHGTKYGYCFSASYVPAYAKIQEVLKYEE